MLSFFDLKHPYLTRHLIAYIGNKRALLGFLHYAVSRICNDLDQERVVFLDPFAGSGAVARLARLMGLKVLANDWEFYSYIINRAHLAVNAGEAAELFADRGGYEGIFSFLNNLSPPPETERYISRYYSPQDTAAADYRRERLFYTLENGLRIDGLRSKIEELYPGFAQEESNSRSNSRSSSSSSSRSRRRRIEKELLLASLLYQCATHTNTSGVFKACHKGFGGHGKDALKRIMEPIHLEMPVLIDSAERTEVFRLDAAQFLSGRSGDICYIDPPYNQHQYGSNYHLLNTIALWDKPAADIEFNTAGVLKNKAAIRRDWVKTKSPYCYKESAPEAFRMLLSSIDCRYLMVSYNTEGIIPFGELTDMLASQGRLDLFTSDYIKYKGGKQSISRKVNNLEFLLVVDRKRSSNQASQARVADLLVSKKLTMLLKSSFNPGRIAEHFTTQDSWLVVESREGRDILLPMPHLYRLDQGFELQLLELAIDEQRELIKRLNACECRDKMEEIGILVNILTGKLIEGERLIYSRRVLYLLRKFAFRKYRREFESVFAHLSELAAGSPELFDRVGQGLMPLARLAAARFNG